MLCSALATLTLLLLWKIYIFENRTDPSTVNHHKFHFLPNESILFRCQYIYLKKHVTEDNVFMFPTEDSISMWSSFNYHADFKPFVGQRPWVFVWLQKSNLWPPTLQTSTLLTYLNIKNTFTHEMMSFNFAKLV